MHELRARSRLPRPPPHGPADQPVGVQGSTRLAREHPETWDAAQARHHDILRNAIDCHKGYVFQVIGDAFCAAFHTAGDALQAAVKAQMELNSDNWGDTPIKVRMGIHTGKAEIRENGEYQGYQAMSRVQRLMSAGHGGQVLVSAASQELLLEDLPTDVSFRDMGERRLKDLIRPEHIYQLVVPGLPVDFPPLKTLETYRHNLPLQLTSFIGRKMEMEETKRSVLAHRLVTLTGVGGTGKTKLVVFIRIMSGFWLMFMQVFDMLPNFIVDWVDSSALVTSLHVPAWMLQPDSDRAPQLAQEWMINANAGLIILLVVPLSWLVSRLRRHAWLRAFWYGGK